MKSRSSRLVAFVAVFAAIDVILSAIPGWWISWAAVIKPLHGIYLGPLGGALAALIGGVIGNVFWPQTAVLALFTWVPGLVGAFGAGLLVKRQWKAVAFLLGIPIVAFYLDPIGKTLALWALYDKVIALVLVYPAAILLKKMVDSGLEWKYLTPTMMLISFVGTQIDNTVGNDLFIFLRLYDLFGISADALLPMYVTGAFVMTAQRIAIAIIAGIVGAPLLKFIRSKGMPWPLT